MKSAALLTLAAIWVLVLSSCTAPIQADRLRPGEVRSDLAPRDGGGTRGGGSPVVPGPRTGGSGGIISPTPIGGDWPGSDPGEPPGGSGDPGGTTPPPSRPGFPGLIATPSLAKPETLVRIRFSSSQPLFGFPQVTVNGQTAFLTGADGSSYCYSYVTRSDDPSGQAEIAISGVDLYGNSGSLTDTRALRINNGPPEIGEISDNSSDYAGGVVPRFDKYELTFQVTYAGTPFVDYNPFNPEINLLEPITDYYNLRGIRVDGILTAPDGSVVTYPAFWYGDGTWKLRFAPTTAGAWNVQIRATDSGGTAYSEVRQFQVSEQTTNPGFVSVDPQDRRFFRFSNGPQFHPIGCDLDGYTGGGQSSAWAKAFGKMADYGANFSRVFRPSLSIEPYCGGGNKSRPQALNRYDVARAAQIDELFDLARQYGIYIQWTVDDWTYLKDASNQYIRASDRPAPCADVDEFFASPTAREIYKRKLRYWMARWGYSTNLFTVEFVNELYGGGAATPSWHVEMADYVHSFSSQPHLASSSNGSTELRTEGGIPWDSPSLDFVNFHDYARYSCGWKLKGAYNLDPLGSTLLHPWQDTAVWADRVARVHSRCYQWAKPLMWTEFGLIYIRSDGKWLDWDAAYKCDPEARHVKEAIWAGMLAGCSVTHWKMDYLMGLYGGGTKFWVYGPLANFVRGEDFAGLTQETAYPVFDPLNPRPGVSSSNPKVMAVGMRGPTRAYLYIKNLTSNWFQNYDLWSDPAAAGCQTPPPARESTVITISGLAPGDYTLEEWSTTEPDPAAQIVSTSDITVGSDGVAAIIVDGLDVDAAAKLKLR